MRFWPGVAVAMLAALPSLAGDAAFYPRLPSELAGSNQPGVEWERIEGSFVSGRRQLAYVLYVDPGYSGLYRLTRYRVTNVVPGGDGGETRTDEAEVLLWNPRPGVREPLHCYAFEASGPAGEIWRSVVVGSSEYRAAMQTAVSVYAAHGEALRRQP